MNGRATTSGTSAPQFEALSTAGLPARRRAAYWNRLLSGTVTAADFEPADSQNFSAELVRARIGDVWLIEVRSDAAAVRYPTANAPPAFGAMCSLQLVLEGVSTERQWGRETQLRPGDFALYTNTSTEPYEATHRTPLRKLILAMPRQLMRRYLPRPEGMAAVAMSGDGGVSGFASTLLRQYWSRCRAEPTAVMRPQVVHGVLELVASAYTSLPEARTPSPSAAAQRARAVAYIESHLLEPDLAPGRVAAALQMTARNLHYVFSHERETVCQYILRRRLEESVRALTASAPLRTTAGIAVDYCFCSASQYGLAFRRLFGLTPSAYRRRYRSNAPA